MYIADMGFDSAHAKYYHKNNSIYFNKNINFEKLSDVAIHECIHYIQEIRDEHDNTIRMGLYDCSSRTSGLMKLQFKQCLLKQI